MSLPNELLFLCPICKIKIPQIKKIINDTHNNQFISLKCPCTSRTQILPLHSFLGSLHKINKDIFCSFHENQKGVQFCSSCEKFICLECANKHKSYYSNHSVGVVHDKCLFHTGDNLIWFFCKDCNQKICKECFKADNFEHKNHNIIFIEDLWKEKHNLLKFKTENDYKMKYDSMITSLSDQIKKINDIIFFLNEFKEKCEEQYILLTHKNKDSLKLISILYYNFYNNKNITSIQNISKIKQNFDSFYIDISKISTYLDKFFSYLNNTSKPQFNHRPFLFDINELLYDNRILPLRQPKTYPYTLSYKTINISPSFISYLEDISFTPFTQSIEHIRNGDFIYVLKNKFIIHNIFTDKKKYSEENFKILPKFRALNLSNHNLIALSCNHDFFIMNTSTMKIIRHINMENMHIASMKAMYVIKAVELNSEFIAMLTSDCTVRILNLQSNENPLVVYIIDENSYDMVKIADDNLMVTSNDKIKIINPYRKSCEGQWRINNVHGINNVDYKFYIQFLFSFQRNTVIASDGNCTAFWDIERKNISLILGDFKTRKVVQLRDERLLLFNGCDITRIYDNITKQIVLVINIEGNIVSWFKLYDGRIGYAGTKGVKLLN